MPTLPRISIVTPSFNQARYIGWTARSVFLQRYPNLQYIVMDGGSTDGTREVLSPYRDSCAHFVSERDDGQADAICRGFSVADGEIMAYLNSDDMLAPGALHYVARFFADHPEIDAVYSHRIAVDSDNKVIWHWILPPHRNWYMMRWDLIPQETCFWRRRLFDRCGNVDATFRFALDYDLFLRYMRAGKFARLNRFLGVFREHDQAKTTRLMETIGADETRQIWKKYGLRAHWLHPYVSARFYHGVVRNGGKFAARKRKLPGALPGVGYDYNQVWGGLLDENIFPAGAGGSDKMAVVTA